MSDLPPLTFDLITGYLSTVYVSCYMYNVVGFFGEFMVLIRLTLLSGY